MRLRSSTLSSWVRLVRAWYWAGKALRMERPRKIYLRWWEELGAIGWLALQRGVEGIGWGCGSVELTATSYTFLSEMLR